MAPAFYLDLKFDLFLKINLIIEQLSTKKNTTLRRYLKSCRPSFNSLKYKKKHKKNFRSKSISFIITPLYTGILDY